MKSLLGTLVVENNGGGGGSLGAAAVARARPDGYTLMLGGTITHVNEALLKSRPLYDPVKDLDPIATVAAARHDRAGDRIPSVRQDAGSCRDEFPHVSSLRLSFRRRPNWDSLV